jgi:predicted  nucleic acid-binding Zn-ribbon protein
MNSNLQNLIELQKLDDVIRELSAEVASLPRRIAEIESTLSSHIKQVEADKHALAENQKSRRRREGEIAALRDKISHFKDQSLQVKTNEQYKALLHEVEYHESQIRQIEDQILGEMIESENLDKRVREAEARLAVERKRAGEEIAVAEQRRREDDQKLEQLRSVRQGIVSQITLEVYETYERISKGRKGVAVVVALDETCGGCHVHMRPQVYSEVMTNEQLHTCESCGRILYFVPPPVSNEDDGAEKATSENAK